MVVVTSVNDLPSLSAIADQRLEPNTNSSPISMTIGDLETLPNDLLIFVSSSSPGVMSATAVQINGTGSNRFLVLTTGSQTGSAELMITVTDQDGGSVSNRFNVTVASTVIAPQITSHPQSLVVTNGGLAAFSVAATGTQPIFQWRRNGADLAGKTNSILVIPTVTPGDAGSYDARVSNAAGTVLSSNALLRVLVTPTITGLSHDPSGLIIRLTTTIGLTYNLESAVSLTDPVWEFVTSLPGTGSEIALLDSSSVVPKKFYRVRVQ
jgi:hypothetical protein